MDVLRLIRMGASEKDTRAAFTGWTELPPHPTKTALGFVGREDGHPIAVICYFAKGLFTSHLARAVINFFPERPTDDEASRRHATIMQELIALFGPPQHDDADSVRSAPEEFRQSRQTDWVVDGNVLTLSLALLRDGVRARQTAVALSVADPKRDPIAQTSAELYSAV